MRKTKSRHKGPSPKNDSINKRNDKKRELKVAKRRYFCPFFFDMINEEELIKEIENK